MPKYTNEQLMDFYKKLPKDLQEAILSVDSAEKIRAIGEKYHLAIDKMGEMADETGLVMLGLTSPREFIPNLASRLNVDKEMARKIAEEINGQVFVRVRESLKKVHAIKEEGGGKEEHPQKAEILNEIEKDEKEDGKEEIPPILRGIAVPPAPSEVEVPHPFEAKIKNEVFRIPPEERKYKGSDPYRELVK